MTVTSFPDMIYSAAKFNNSPCCLDCGRTQTLTLIEPLNRGFELRRYHCFKCDVIETFVVEL